MQDFPEEESTAGFSGTLKSPPKMSNPDVNPVSSRTIFWQKVTWPELGK